MGDEMPADPFRDGLPDWGPLAANDFSFFASHLAAGFTEAQALELTARYISFVVTISMSQPAQQQPDPPEA
jgi:hypothetical protein